MTDDKTENPTLTHRLADATIVPVSESTVLAVKNTDDRFGPYVRLMFVISLVLLATDAIAFVTAAVTFPVMTPTSYLAITVFSITFVLILVFAHSAYWRSRNKQAEGMPNEVYTNIFTHLACIYSGVVLSLIVAAEISSRN